MIIIVDSDGLIGMSHTKDAHYSKAVELLKRLQKNGAQLIFPATVIAEATAVLQIRLNNLVTANSILDAVKTGSFVIEPIDEAILIGAISFLTKKRNKHITLFDGIIAVVATKHHADAIFSFDKFYKKNGFKLAEEL